MKLLIVRNDGDILDCSGMFDMPPLVIRIPVPRKHLAPNSSEEFTQLNTTEARLHNCQANYNPLTSDIETTFIYIEDEGK
jgi:hypothetical protein